METIIITSVTTLLIGLAIGYLFCFLSYQPLIKWMNEKSKK